MLKANFELKTSSYIADYCLYISIQVLGFIPAALFSKKMLIDFKIKINNYKPFI
jgi:hypothetical protein